MNHLPIFPWSFTCFLSGHVTTNCALTPNGPLDSFSGMRMGNRKSLK